MTGIQNNTNKLKQALTTGCFALLTLGLWGQAAAQGGAEPRSLSDEEQAFIAQVSQDAKLDRDALTRLLQNAELNEDVLAAIQRPWEAKPWHQYHPIFLTDKRVAAGVKFWQAHAETLDRATATYGVPAEMIVAIIGVETFYGTYKGKYPVIDALYTLGFHYPPRETFFRKELGEFMQLVEEEQLDATQVVGSYAGAMGLGQFISSSYRYYAVDFDDDGQRDLMQNPVDAIGSVANYFAKHGWSQDAPIAFPLTSTEGEIEETAAPLATDTLKPKLTVAELQQQGLKLPASVAQQVDDAALANVLALDQPAQQDYWLTLNNFYVITRYNHSPLYAMAVYQLSEQIKAAYEQAQAR